MVNPPNIKDEDRLHALIELWREVVSVQKHFNDIEMKIRGLALTAAAAVLAGVGFAIKEDISLQASGGSFPLGSALCTLGFIVVFAFWFMDRHWYHKLLYGAVKQGQAIEAEIKKFGLPAGLTDSIGKESPLMVSGKTIRSKQKIDIFYFPFASTTICGSFAFFDWIFGFSSFLILFGLFLIYLFYPLD